MEVITKFLLKVYAKEGGGGLGVLIIVKPYTRKVI